MTAHEYDESNVDTVRVYFKDGSTTVIHVLHDESIRDAITQLCHDNGWPIDSVARYSIE